MNTLLEALSLNAEPTDPRYPNAERARKADRIAWRRSDPRPFRQEAGERMLDCRARGPRTNPLAEGVAVSVSA